MTDRTDAMTCDAIALDHTKLLGYWLLPQDRLTLSGDGQQVVNLKMGTKGNGTKFFGGTAGIRRRAD
ncbi:hypothetical protein [Histidinibacterium lentulum]|uniref:Uncharacterized protein n=1 Tax=Histidinibacterium lentulum TaxID=2480588 RepID=A0A3N2R609_9RHOB|nr:hypothetical protein [Histidinibacterium lentulum]ROU02837.1 hypothetical protein EAT49_05910 [Histidinibacterium lentulum]